MKLQMLLQDIPLGKIKADLNQDISGISYDSRTVQPGELFVAMPGFQTDGHDYIDKAVEQGASVILCQNPPKNPAIPYIQTENSRRALAILGANFFGHPADDMIMIGITGTNGKTSSTYLLKAILEQAIHAKVGLIGTNQNMIGSEILSTERTTPESFELQKLFAQMRDVGCTHVVMEVSSHALALDRVYGVHFAVGLFTNLTQDHLDFHKTMENYCNAKAILFQNCDTGILNADDPWTERLAKNASCQKLYFYSEHEKADLTAKNIILSADSIAFDAVTKELKKSVYQVPVQVHIPGDFMIYNTLGVLSAAMALGISLETSAEILCQVPHIKGRVEVVPTPGKDYTVLIDYAHSPDGLKNVLSTVKGFAKGRTIALFGCGGDRDRAKRPKMGRIAAELADFVIITSDNPRTEKPGDIIAEILPGLENSQTPYIILENRVEAIHWAMDHAEKNDVIVLCGKGHETYQEINHVKNHMDEREIVSEYLLKN